MKSGYVLLILLLVIGGAVLYVRKFRPDLWARILTLFGIELGFREELPEAAVTGRPHIPGIDPYSGLPIMPWIKERPWIYGIDPYSGLPIKRGGIPITL